MLTNGWTCPYCNRIATITQPNYIELENYIHTYKGVFILKVVVVNCPNSECQKYTITSALYNTTKTVNNLGRQNYNINDDPLQSWNMIPQSHAKQFPDYVPKAIIADYEEACLIQDLSPKASATLSRRCLQGIIRNFLGIKEGTLYAEINAIQGKVDPQTWKAIDGVRSIGNIGAHMEKDINLIIDVEPNEAAALIRLIEILIKDWYVARHERESDLKSVIAIADQKKKEKKEN
ncbi:MAG: DUF4145 domain-containing protein [Candidatus Poribacteria bacterium]|nr:DUF4145 domain-containing protein [Candidatus Poribacteria bacterium]